MPNQNQKIKTEFQLENIAPIESLTRAIESNSIKFGIFANNGSGKTFISRMFRLTEKQAELELEENGKSPIDKLITLGKNQGSFKFKITDKHGSVVEDFKINLTTNNLPKIPDTNYLFHVFNEDYVEENLKSFDFDKDGDIDGFILGKVNIDLSKDEEELETIKNQSENLNKLIEKEISEFVTKKVDVFKDIRRLSDYKELSPKNIMESIDKLPYNISKSYDELVKDYNKIKSVPDNLESISEINDFSIDIEFFNETSEKCQTEYSLSVLSTEFKSKIKLKQGFIERGLSIKSDYENSCPFCEQELQESALELIDEYTSYLNNIEATAINQFNQSNKNLEEYILKLVKLKNHNLIVSASFNEYKEKYIPTMDKQILEKIETESLERKLKEITKIIDRKILNVSQSALVPAELIDSIIQEISNLRVQISANNTLIQKINSKKENIKAENRSVRKKICNKSVNILIEKHKENTKNLNILKNQYNSLKASIEKKKEQKKTSKKTQVANTIKTVLDYFFSSKYTLDEDTFRLTFKNNVLEKRQAQNILSAGEKNIVAFAYFLGDTHLKIESDDDYKKLFFIIDDPISSMDFSHVYTVCGVIRDIKKIIVKITYERFIIFTHNQDFMRIISGNNIIDKTLLLSNNELSDFNNSLTVPYITHLMDIYKIARKSGMPNHTTANSIRHILETLAKFESIETNRGSIKEYIKTNIPNEKKSYTLIQDLSHGGWRSEQAPITNIDFKEVCELVVSHIEKKYSGQIDYCSKNC